MRKKLIVTIIMVALTGIGWFPALAIASDMGELVSLLSDFKTYKAGFSQQSLDQKGKELQNLAGIIILQKPDHFYWESNDPNAQKLVSNGKTIWHYDVDLEQVVIQDYAKQAEQTPILVVLRDPETLAKSFKLAQVKHKNKQISFRLEALEKNASLKTVELGFENGVLNRLDFVDNLQQRTAIVFTSPQMNEKLDPALFEFALPDGADVLYE